MAVRIVMPKLGMVMSEGMVTRWTVAGGERVARGDVIAEIETEKVNYDLEATADGVLHPVAEVGASIVVDGLLGYLLEDGEAPPEPEPPPAPTPRASAGRASAPAVSPPARPSGGEVRSTPGARKAAISLGVDISKVSPTGPRGRVTEADVRALAGATAEPAMPPGLPAPSESVPLEGKRKVIAARMRASLASTAQLSYFLEVDITEAQRLRRERSSGRGITLTFADVIMKASAFALKRVPALNAVLVGETIHRFETANIGLAVSLDDGLIVPVVEDVASKSVFEIGARSRELVERARDGTLAAADLAGGTFTISVLGLVDGFTPILNAGQTAILGIGRSAPKPIVVSGEVVIREISTLSLTVDHQVVDGVQAATFLRRLQQAIERPVAIFEG